jgi:hypothetical protein
LLAEQQWRVKSAQQIQIHATVSEQQTKLNTILAKLPTLEQEKKLAAAARNFKEAGRVSSEIKSLQSAKEEVIQASSSGDDFLTGWLYIVPLARSMRCRYRKRVA